tara:strand:+ start:814 stop:1065 length:252 start_codon:yes stop_codon:yes gene_type:complete
MSKLANMKSIYGLGRGGQGSGTHQTRVVDPLGLVDISPPIEVRAQQSMFAPGQGGGNQVNYMPPQVTVGIGTRDPAPPTEYAF